MWTVERGVCPYSVRGQKGEASISKGAASTVYVHYHMHSRDITFCMKRYRDFATSTNERVR